MVFWVWCFGFGVLGLVFWVWCFGFGVLGALIDAKRSNTLLLPRPAHSLHQTTFYRVNTLHKHPFNTLHNTLHEKPSRGQTPFSCHARSRTLSHARWKGFPFHFQIQISFMYTFFQCHGWSSPSSSPTPTTQTQSIPPLSGEYGSCKTVKARLRPWRPGKSLFNLFRCCCFARKRGREQLPRGRRALIARRQVKHPPPA